MNLKECPTSGTGVHRWLFGAACACVDEGLTDEEAEPLIRKAMTRRPTPPSEITDALRSARREERVPSMVWDPRNETAIKAIIDQPWDEVWNEKRTWPVTHNSFKHADSKWLSIKPLYKDPSTGYFLDWLFPGNPLLCIGKTSSLFGTQTKSEWRMLAGKNSLIVPSPMSAIAGKTKAGHMSEHSLDNTGPRQYLVTEFDSGTELEQLKILMHLATYGPLVMIVQSGGKSLHAWWNATDVEVIPLLSFMQYAVSLGADPRTWLPSQFVRMPDGTRFENKKRQAVIYFDHSQLDYMVGPTGSTGPVGPSGPACCIGVTGPIVTPSLPSIVTGTP